MTHKVRICDPYVVERHILPSFRRDESECGYEKKDDEKGDKAEPLGSTGTGGTPTSCWPEYVCPC